ncbi:MAG TPA: flagellar hook-length control protein FliK [Terriglobales bacterium]|nr:flagellar hook-length control protein FliK [Terriglobales bacterium]
MPVNAPQFGAAINGPAAPASSSSPFSFLAAGSTNPEIPDFKTIAASFFAVPTATTTVAPVETKSAAGAKSVGPFLPREREGNKEKDDQSSELPATFLPTIPVYQFPVLTAQAPKHMEPMNPQQQTATKDGSSAPSFTLPIENQRQGFNQTLPPQPVTRPVAPNVPFVPSQQTLKNVWPHKAAVEPAQLDDSKNTAVQDTPNADAKTVMPAQTFVDANPTTNIAALDDINAGEAVKETAEVPETLVGPKTQAFPSSPVQTQTVKPQPKIASATVESISTDKEDEPSVAKNITAGLNTTEIDTLQKNATSFGEKLSPKFAKPTAASENKKSTETKESFDAQQNDGTNTNPADSTTAADQTSQQNTTPQSLDDAIRAVIPQAVEHSVKGQTSAHTTSLRATPSVKSAANKSNQAESNLAEANAIASPASEKSSPEQLDAPRAVSAVESTTKAAAKTKSDATIKKTQKLGTDDQTDSATTNLGSTRTEVQPASASQNTVNKVHDAAAQLNVGPHAKSTSAKNAPEGSDLTSPNATQIPDIDDITPPAHTGVNIAKLIQSLTQSELRVGLQTRDFGNIDIRTSASRHEFSAQISVEHSEVAHTLTSELPNLYARLNEQQVPVTNIHIHNQSLSTSSGLDQRSQQSAQQSQSNGFMKQHAEPTLPSVHEVFASTDRLDIRV